MRSMVSFHTALAGAPPAAEFEASSNKRKWEDPPLPQDFLKDQIKADHMKSIFGIELHLETPLPSDKWQQYLSIQTGKMHNTKMSKKQAEDRKRSPETEPACPAGRMSLDLGLNITCESPRNKQGGSYGVNEKQNRSSYEILNEHDLFVDSRKEDKKCCSGGLTRSPSWLSSEVDHREMVATVCMRCHMLVMLCKSSPACPNCKFMHPPDQNPSTFLKRRCTQPLVPVHKKRADTGLDF